MQITKLQDVELGNVYGGSALVGGGLIILGIVTAVTGLIGVSASEITSTICVLKANKALDKGDISSGKKFSEIARRAKIAAISCGACVATGSCVLIPIGAKISGNAFMRKTSEIPIDSFLQWLSSLPPIPTLPFGSYKNNDAV